MCTALATTMALAVCTSAFGQGTPPAQQQTTTTTTTTPSGTQQTTTTTTTVIPPVDLAHRISVGDQIFLMDLVHSNALEIELAKSAYRMAWSKGVSDYAKMIMDDHAALQNQLMSQYGNAPWMMDWQHSLRQNPVRDDVGMAYFNQNGYASYSTTNYLSTGQNPNPPSNGYNAADENGVDNWMYLDASDWDKVHYLRGLNGWTFDKVFAEDMVQGHRMLMGKIWEESQRTANADIQNLISQVQPTIQKHLQVGRMISYNYDDPTGIGRQTPYVR